MLLLIPAITHEVIGFRKRDPDFLAKKALYHVTILVFQVACVGQIVLQSASRAWSARSVLDNAFGGRRELVPLRIVPGFRRKGCTPGLGNRPLL
eukprot:1128363-Rhodomonas_salina.1